MAFKLAKLSVPDIGKAYGAGLTMKQTRLSNEVKEEAIAQKKATNEEYGNFLSKNNPASVVDPVDENNNGKIDPEEETNALQATGRKYKAWDKIRDDKEIAARRAAVEGRSRRNEQRAIEKHQKYMERNELAASQKQNIEHSHREVGKELGYTGARLDQYVQLAMKDKNLAQAAFRQLNYNDQIKKTTETDEGQKQVYLITKEYTDAYGKGSPEEIKTANTAAMKKLNGMLDGMDLAIEAEQAKGNTKKVAKIKRLKEKYKTLKKPDGTFDYKASQKYSAQLADQKQDQTTELENQEDQKYLNDYWETKKKKGSNGREPAAIKTANALGDARSLSAEDRSPAQQQLIDKEDGVKPPTQSKVAKAVNKKYDISKEDMLLMSNTEKKEAMDHKRLVRLKAIGLITADRKKPVKQQKYRYATDEKVVEDAEEIVSKRSKSKGSKKSKGKKSLGKSTKEDGATAKTKDGRAVITENGQWVLK